MSHRSRSTVRLISPPTARRRLLSARFCVPRKARLDELSSLVCMLASSGALAGQPDQSLCTEYRADAADGQANTFREGSAASPALIGVEE
jgi:hypothetical protein